jgi:predicted permease
MLEQLTRDLFYAARGLWRDRTFTLTTVSTLTVAIALVAVVFTVFNAYVLRPYAVRDPYSLYELRWHTRPAGGSGTRWTQSGRTFRWSDYLELQRQGDLFDAVIAERNRSVTSDGHSYLAAFVSGNYFETLGGRVQLGRPLATFDAQTPGAGAVIVLGDQAWTRYFDRDPAVIGTSMRLNDQLLTIVGVMAEAFVGLNDTPPDLWVPVTMHGAVIKQDLFGVQQPRELALIARLRKDRTPDQAAAALSPVMAAVTGRPAPVTAELLPQATPAPLTLELIAALSPVFAAFAVVLLAACANVSNVMLARATARRTEIAMRLSLGASRGRVVAQLLTEGLLIAVMAGVVALGLASLVIRTGLQVLFLTLPPSAAAVTRVVPLDFDYRVFAFTLVTSGLTTIMFALVPALQATRGTLTGALRGETAGLRASTLRNVLVVGQVTASLVLIVLATTLVRNALALKNTDVGFDPSALFSIRQRATGAQLITKAHDALAGDGRFSGIALTSRNPLFGELPRTFIRTTPVSAPPSSAGPDRRRDGVATTYMHVSPEYFAALGVTIVQGRGFDAGEARAESHVAVVSASAAQALWPGGHALGQTFRMWLPPEPPADAVTRADLFWTKDVEEKSFDVVVIGVADDIANEMVYQGRRVPHLYMPTARAGSQARALIVRGRSAADVREAVQAVLRDVDSNPLAFEALPLEEAIALQMYPLTVASWIGMLLSAVALALSVSGLYGMMTYGISHRMKEIGIRMALGASSRSIVRLVLSQSGRLVAIGVAIGGTLSLSALALLRATIDLKNVSILDPGAFMAATAILLLAGAAAAYMPSRRATRVEPWRVLRGE